MLVPVLLFAVGLVLLIKGGDWFVDGATGLARRFHIPEIIVGATVVSIGTTLPEVMVSATGALNGQGAMSYGNAIGSIICNTSLIAAITLAVRPAPVDVQSMKKPVIFFFVAAAVYCFAAYGMGEFTRPLGIVLLAMFVRASKPPLPRTRNPTRTARPSLCGRSCCSWWLARRSLPWARTCWWITAPSSPRSWACRRRSLP